LAIEALSITHHGNGESRYRRRRQRRRDKNLHWRLLSDCLTPRERCVGGPTRFERFWSS
jgi:hypothetical protein